MTEGMGLPDGPVHLHLVGFRPDSFSPSAKIEIRLSWLSSAQQPPDASNVNARPSAGAVPRPPAWRHGLARKRSCPSGGRCSQ
jgi:hypothetical protein